MADLDPNICCIVFNIKSLNIDVLHIEEQIVYALPLAGELGLVFSGMCSILGFCIFAGDRFCHSKFGVKQQSAREKRTAL